jgi:hypothetical protein
MIVIAIVVAVLIGVFNAPPAISDELDEVRQLASALWQPNLPRCSDKQNRPFPSKLNADGSCDDRDMVLFNGLLCASGDNEACNAVSHSQDFSSGEWWRSPRIALDTSIPRSDSFSADQNLGVMLTVLTKQTDPAYRAQLAGWIHWIDLNRPCFFGREPLCARGLPRFCRDDTEGGCTLRPIDMGLMRAVLARLQIQIPEGPFMRDLFAQFTESVTVANIKINASVNDLGFPIHLVGVEIMVMRAAGPTDSDTNRMLRDAAVKLNERQPKNPFFAYLANADPLEVAKLAYAKCPKKTDDIPKDKVQWIWERQDDSTATTQTMLWDCMFIANLFARR